MIRYIAGYKFLALRSLALLKQRLLQATEHLKGTVLISEEGININLAGDEEAITRFRLFLKSDDRFADIRFHEMTIAEQPYKRLKIKIKKEIITLRQPAVDAVSTRAPAITPHQLKQWIEEKREMVLLDTRNDFEVQAGTFEGAVNLHINQFGQFPASIQQLDRDKPIIMFCTGGIRCEKAALHMQNQGFQEVYQLDGGILGYFASIGGEHYKGNCFVFDERIAVKPDLTPCH